LQLFVDGEKAGTSEAHMPLPEPFDLDKAGLLKFDELEGKLKNLNKEIEGDIRWHTELLY